MAANRSFVPEPLRYYISREWPKSRQPAFWDDPCHPVHRTLEDSFEVLRDEIESSFARRPEAFQPNFTPYAYREEGWKTLNLYSYFLRYRKNCARFPRVDEVVRSIPGMCMAQIAVLEPHTRLKAHHGDTNATLRTHLGIRVPGQLPELGIRVGREERGWEEGKAFSISISRRHYAWNDTDEVRIALVVDVIRDEFFERRYEIAGNTLAVILMKACATKLPPLKRLPASLTTALRIGLGSMFRAGLFLQRTTRA